MSNIRKIGKIGGYTRIISLPPFWLNEVMLDVGEYVEFSLGKKKELILKPYKGKTNDKKESMEDRS